MPNPLLVVIIPTLQRPDTLYWTIKTVIEQDYDNFYILVSDNFSNDNTSEIVAAFKDNRIRYVNPGKRLSMSRHWEFALSHINEGFVTIVGDDDALLPGALKKTAALLSKHTVKAIGWRFCNFNWPGLPPYFMIPMANYYRIVKSKIEIQKLFTGSIISTIQFPSLYGGFISIELIKELRSKFGGSFFHSRIPDFFSAAVTAASVDEYLRLEFPLSINATSKHSTGFATINPETSQKSINDLKSNEDNIPMHKDLIFMKSINLAIADALLNTHELIPEFPKVDIKKLLREVLNETSMYSNLERRREITEGVREIARKNNLEQWGEELIAGFTSGEVSSTGNVIIKKYSPISQTLYIHSSEEVVKNVYDASNLAGSIVPGNFHLASTVLPAQFNNIRQFLKYLFLKHVMKKKTYN
jgi:glycosyltransferase involved in cell wall biosynthesis